MLEAIIEKDRLRWKISNVLHAGWIQYGGSTDPAIYELDYTTANDHRCVLPSRFGRSVRSRGSRHARVRPVKGITIHAGLGGILLILPYRVTLLGLLSCVLVKPLI